MKKTACVFWICLAMFGCTSKPFDDSLYTEEGRFSTHGTYQSQELGWEINVPEGLSLMSVVDARKAFNSMAGLMKEDLNIEVNNDSNVFRVGFFCDSLNYFFAYTYYSGAPDDATFLEESSGIDSTMDSWIEDHFPDADIYESTEGYGGRRFYVKRFTKTKQGNSPAQRNETYHCLINGLGLSIMIYSTNAECRTKMYEALKNSTFIKS
jgi:hypothetical protein